MSLATRTAGCAFQAREAAALADQQLQLATAVTADNMQPRSGTAGAYRWPTSYATRPNGLVVASVLIEWAEPQKREAFKLSEVFKPRAPPKSAGD